MTEQTGSGPDQPLEGQPQGAYPPQPGPPTTQPLQPGPPTGQPLQPGPPPQPPSAPYGGAPAPLRPDEERLWAALAHWGGLVLGLLAPLLVYVIYKDRSRWVAETSREALNFQISYTIYLLVAAVSMILLVGFVLFPIVLVAYYVFLLIGAIKVLGNQLYRFPLILRLVG